MQRSQFAQDSLCGRSATLAPLDSYVEAGEDRGILWTPFRRSVLELLWECGSPWGPYGLVDRMRAGGRRVYPTSLYRVLKLLEDAGLIASHVRDRRVQIVPDPALRDWALLQCVECDRSDLVPFAEEAGVIRLAALGHGHVTAQLVIESIGTCRSCTDKPLHDEIGGR